MSCHELVYWSFCASLQAHRAPVHFVRVRSNSCSSMMSSRRCRCWRPRRRRSGRVACWRAVRAGFVVSCRVLPTAGRRGGQPRRPCQALSMDRIHQVMPFCETATWAHRSSVAHLVSLHISYSHRTPREGVRSLSGESVGVTSTNFSCRMTRRQQNGSVWLLNLSCFPSCFARVFPRTDSKDSTAPHAASRLRPASLDILTDYN
jgi:hypothetical protein